MTYTGVVVVVAGQDLIFLIFDVLIKCGLLSLNLFLFISVSSRNSQKNVSLLKSLTELIYLFIYLTFFHSTHKCLDIKKKELP